MSLGKGSDGQGLKYGELKALDWWSGERVVDANPPLGTNNVKRAAVKAANVLKELVQKGREPKMLTTSWNPVVDTPQQMSLKRPWAANCRL